MVKHLFWSVFQLRKKTAISGKFSLEN